MAEIKGGAKLEAALNEIAAKLGKGGSVKVGFLKTATYPDGKPVAMIAAIQDYGAPARNIPPRPFFRNMVAEKNKTWPKAVELNLKATKYDVPSTLDRVGAGIAGQLRQSIIDTNSPPLAPATVAAKGFAKPLVDTGHMLNSIDHQVETS